MESFLLKANYRGLFIIYKKEELCRLSEVKI